jgi:cholinesterase
MFLRLFLLAFTTILVDAVATAPTVQLDAATVTGNSVGNVYEFLGIPFAQPP